MDARAEWGAEVGFVVMNRCRATPPPRLLFSSQQCRDGEAIDKMRSTAYHDPWWARPTFDVRSTYVWRLRQSSIDQRVSCC